mmetsp:Transcript_76060/g.246116  ORF Transcript_76060/g.246116 Transcript_76060/m.246116 type:complete len:123 (+) Transcript_76060:55-423(+)
MHNFSALLQEDMQFAFIAHCWDAFLSIWSEVSCRCRVLATCNRTTCRSRKHQPCEHACDAPSSGCLSENSETSATMSSDSIPNSGKNSCGGGNSSGSETSCNSDSDTRTALCSFLAVFSELL